MGSNLIVGIVGAGTMGHGMAQVFAQTGHVVKLTDLWDGALAKGMSNVKSNLASMVQVGMMTEQESHEVFSRIHPSTNLDSLKGAEFVTEAVNEDLSLKKEIFAKLDDLLPENEILASNTSGLSITEIASALKKPGRVIGTNWWNPPHIIPLVEMMKGERTSDETVRRTKEILINVGKKPILILKPSAGFVGNRLQIALFREALSLLEKGTASIEDIDTAVRYGLGVRYALMGPFRVADLGGLDVFYHLTEALYKNLDCSKEPQEVLARLFSSQKLGFKTGQGFYHYGEDESHVILTERDQQLLRILKAMK